MDSECWETKRRPTVVAPRPPLANAARACPERSRRERGTPVQTKTLRKRGGPPSSNVLCFIILQVISEFLAITLVYV